MKAVSLKFDNFVGQLSVFVGCLFEEQRSVVLFVGAGVYGSKNKYVINYKL